MGYEGYDCVAPLRLLKYSWVVEANSEVEAVFKAMLKCVRIQPNVVRRRFRIVRVYSNLYKIIDVERCEMILVRVMEKYSPLGDSMSTLPGGLREMYARTLGVSGGRKFIVTFYPQTYRRL